MFNWKTISLASLSTLLLVSCGPKKEEQAPPAQSEEKDMMPPQKPHEEKPLTPKEEDELKIEEDEVMNPFPG